MPATTMEQIEKIKSEYTDKYVVVDAERPELARFRDLVGQVKTVNMSGRALVEFLDYNVNISWFDIDLDYLKVVDKPAPKPKEEAKPAAKKAPVKPAAKTPADGGEKKLSPLELARQQGSAGGAKKADKPAAEKKSTADILAAARGGAKPAAAEKPATPAKPTGGKKSTADILAAARGDAKSGGDPPEPEPDPAPTPEPEPAAAAASEGPVKVDKSTMSVDEMIAYCREHDA